MSTLLIWNHSQMEPNLKAIFVNCIFDIDLKSWSTESYMYMLSDFSNSFKILNCIGDVMVGVLNSSVVDHGFDLWSSQIKDYNWYFLLLH